MPTALIVDDNPQDAYLLRCVLAADGFELVEASNGREALQRATERPVDLVISDILMPVMDGFSLCREWKKDPARRRTPFVFYTATYVDKKDEDFALNLGADLFIVKPADPSFLRERLAHVLAKRRSDRVGNGAQGDGEVPILRQYNAVLIHKLEDKLFELERLNQALRIKDLALATSASGILLTAPSGEVSYANPSMARLCGKPGTDLVGQRVERLFVNPEPVVAWLSSSAAPGPVELQLVASAGQPPVWVQVRGHVVTDEGDRRLGLMVSCLDISGEKRLRQELARVQRLEALSLFAAGVAHDFNNLLMSMYAGLDLPEVERLPESERGGDQAMALAAFERAKDLTRRLLTFSKGSTAKRRAVDVSLLLDESVSLALSGSSVRCERRYASSLPSAWGDAGQLAQVFSNLLVNARQAMKDRGTIVVSARVDELPASSGLAAGRYLSIEVKDDGPGIPPDVLPHVFEPYFTTKSEGSGLGLATCQAIVQEHAGRLTVATGPSEGTTFEVLIPSTPEVAEPAPGATPVPARSSTGRILVMDDQVSIQALLQGALERAGHSVVATSNGEQALLEFERARAEGRGFDLVLLDITVRGGMGGVEALAKLRRLEPRVVAIATTGYSDDGAQDDLRTQGFVHVLPKPFLPHELLGTIKAVLSPD